MILVQACGSKDSTGPTDDLAPLVGDWNAEVLVITSVADPDITVDLIALEAKFTLNVQPSGQYTAILIYNDQAQTEIGTVSVAGNTLSLDRVFPSASTTSGTFSLVGDRLTLDGNTEFDFDLNGTAEAARVHFELVRQ